MGQRLAQRVLLLGWDGADWKVIQSLLDRGQLPNLEGLINRGVMGNLATLQPILSPMLWTSVATGKRADQHGIHGFIEPRPDGSGIRPVTSTSLRAQPLWNILPAHGLRSAVTGWFATYPADCLQGTVVSDVVVNARGASFEDWPLPERVVSPVSLREVMASQAQMLERSDKAGSRLDQAELARVFGKALKKVQDWLFAQENIEVLYVDYAETLERPRLTAERVRDFLGCELNTAAMARAVDPGLRRQGAS